MLVDPVRGLPLGLVLQSHPTGLSWAVFRLGDTWLLNPEAIGVPDWGRLSRLMSARLSSGFGLFRGGGGSIVRPHGATADQICSWLV